MLTDSDDQYDSDEEEDLEEEELMAVVAAVAVILVIGATFVITRRLIARNHVRSFLNGVVFGRLWTRTRACNRTLYKSNHSRKAKLL